jgi:hypothetical protein
LARGRKTGMKTFNPKTHKTVRKTSSGRTGMGSGF